MATGTGVSSVPHPSTPFHTLPLRTLSCVGMLGSPLNRQSACELAPVLGAATVTPFAAVATTTTEGRTDHGGGGGGGPARVCAGEGRRGGGEPGSSTISTPHLQRALGVLPQPHHDRYHSHSHARLDGLDRRPQDPTASNPAHLALHSSPSILSPSCDHNNLHNTTVLAPLPPPQHTHTNNQNPLKLPIFNYDLLLLFLLDPAPKNYTKVKKITHNKTHTHTHTHKSLNF
jgi:hypothetical protein